MSWIAHANQYRYTLQYRPNSVDEICDGLFICYDLFITSFIILLGIKIGFTFSQECVRLVGAVLYVHLSVLAQVLPYRFLTVEMCDLRQNIFQAFWLADWLLNRLSSYTSTSGPKNALSLCSHLCRVLAFFHIFIHQSWPHLLNVSNFFLFSFSPQSLDDLWSHSLGLKIVLPFFFFLCLICDYSVDGDNFFFFSYSTSVPWIGKLIIKIGCSNTLDLSWLDFIFGVQTLNGAFYFA